MRASLFSAAVVVALAVSAGSLGRAQAQIVILPVISTGSSNPVVPSYYSYPTYSYGYTYTYPVPVYSTWPAPAVAQPQAGTGAWAPMSRHYTPEENAWIGSRYWGVGYGPYKKP